MARGRTGRLDVDGYRIDTGPTVITMPEIIDETLAAVGKTRAGRLELLPVDPAYRAVFADGSALDVHSDPDEMAAAVERFAGPAQAAGYRRLREWLQQLYRTEFDGFIGANFDSPLSLLTPQLARLAALGGFRKWDRVIERYISDPRLRRVFTFQSLYAGVAPKDALAVYAVIAYMDTIAGVVFPVGACGRCPTRWPARRPRPASGSATARRSRRWSEAATGSAPCARTTPSGSGATRWS